MPPLFILLSLLRNSSFFQPGGLKQRTYLSSLPIRIRREVDSGCLVYQQEAWNRHDLGAFMAGYWNSEELTFFSGAKEHQGWKATIDRYRATYSSPGHEMGKLEFSGLRIEALGADAAFVRGSWLLTMSDGKTPHGLFTLVFRKFPDG